jgi:hypothetical protein
MQMAELLRLGRLEQKVFGNIPLRTLVKSCGMGLGSATGAVSRVSRVSRTGAEVAPGLSRAEQKRRWVTWGKRWASVEVPVMLQWL